jgi:hypothetical protein
LRDGAVRSQEELRRFAVLHLVSSKIPREIIAGAHSREASVVDVESPGSFVSKPGRSRTESKCRPSETIFPDRVPSREDVT